VYQFVGGIFCSGKVVTFWFLPICFSTSDPSIFGFYHIQAGAKVNVSAGGATPLHIAADNGSLELINSLLKAGADPNVSDEVRHIKFPNFIIWLI